jgi:sugar/nucleoside kinase (ribokinase family)
VQASELRALVVGAVTWDREVGRASRRTTPGGVVTFAGRTLARLGARTRVVTRVAALDNAVLAPLREAGVEVLALPSSRTTTYVNHYGPAGDRHELGDRSDPITAGDVPAEWLRTADIVQAGPLHPTDVDAAAVAGARGLVGVDLQGLTRDPARGHADVVASVRAWCATAAVVQASAADVPTLFDATSPRAIRAAYGIAELVVTRGARGATLATHAGVVEIAARSVTGGDPRGAGDTFLAVYLVGRVTDLAPAAAAETAARLTAEAVSTGAVPRRALD